MCGRFSQAMTREDYLSLIVDEADRNIAYDPAPIGRYNVAPGTRVLLLSERDEQLQLDPVHWGYAPTWWDKTPLINARVETRCIIRSPSMTCSAREPLNDRKTAAASGVAGRTATAGKSCRLGARAESAGRQPRMELSDDKPLPINWRHHQARSYRASSEFSIHVFHAGQAANIVMFPRKLGPYTGPHIPA